MAREMPIWGHAANSNDQIWLQQQITKVPALMTQGSNLLTEPNLHRLICNHVCTCVAQKTHSACFSSLHMHKYLLKTSGGGKRPSDGFMSGDHQSPSSAIDGGGGAVEAMPKGG